MTELRDQLISYERGDLSNRQTLRLFSTLGRTGVIQVLPPHYTKLYSALRRSGCLDRSGNVVKRGGQA